MAYGRFFFVLSGFVIALNYLDKIFTFKDIILFQKKRFLRLYPLHFIMLIIFLFIEITKYIAEAKFGLNANNKPFTTNNLVSFLANIFLIQNYTVSNLTFNTPSWSISAEFYTYFLFALIFFFNRGRKKIITIILLLNIIGCGYLLNKYGMSTANGPLRCLYAFSFGVLIFILYTKIKNKYKFSSSFPSALTIIITILIITKMEGGGRVDPNNYKYSVLTILLFGGVILSLVLTKSTSSIYLFLSKKYLVYMGTISYGIYMVHAAVWWLINQFLRFVVKVDTKIQDTSEIIIVVNNPILSSFIAFLGMTIIILLSHFSYKSIEKKFYFK
jgi:peptidoglycan/LPS O-acetylase OafA/YrhL